MDKNSPKGALNLLEVQRRLLLPLTSGPQQIRHSGLLRHNLLTDGLRHHKKEANLQRLQQRPLIFLRHEASLRQLRQIQRHGEPNSQACHRDQESFLREHEANWLHELICIWRVGGPNNLRFRIKLLVISMAMKRG